MQTIPLSQGQSVIVDDADHPLLSELRWCYRPERGGKQGYAVRHVKVDGKDRLCYLHRQLMQPAEGYEVIFLNGDKLDCRRANLRMVTIREARQHHLRARSNSENARSNSQSGIRGISYNSLPKTWSVDIYRDGRPRRVGTFDTLKEAKEARQRFLLLDNPDLHTAPPVVDRASIPAPDQQASADAC